MAAQVKRTIETVSDLVNLVMVEEKLANKDRPMPDGSIFLGVPTYRFNKTYADYLAALQAAGQCKGFPTAIEAVNAMVESDAMVITGTKRTSKGTFYRILFLAADSNIGNVRTNKPNKSADRLKALGFID